MEEETAKDRQLQAQRDAYKLRRTETPVETQQHLCRRRFNDQCKRSGKSETVQARRLVHNRAYKSRRRKEEDTAHREQRLASNRARKAHRRQQESVVQRHQRLTWMTAF